MSGSNGVPAAAPAGAAQITYVGHATVAIELDGIHLLTDPLLRNRVLHLRRSAPAVVPVAHPFDAVLISHAHWDHLDMRSLELLPGDPTAVVPRGVARLLRRRFSAVVELEAGESLELGALVITATHADHDARRGPLGLDAPALGYVVAGSRRIYFAGDTDVFAGMAELTPLDLALLPVSGWGGRVPAGHLDPRRAVEALGLLQPRVAVPIHWGTYSALTQRHPRSGFEHSPAEEFARLAGELAPAVDVRVLELGETLDLAEAG